jgi:hypothetical protein
MIPNGAQQLAEQLLPDRPGSCRSTTPPCMTNGGVSVSWFTTNLAATGVLLNAVNRSTMERIVEVRSGRMRMTGSGTRVTEDGR